MQYVATVGEMIAPYWAVIMMVVLGLGFAVPVLILTHLLGPRRNGPIKGTAYESGMNPITSSQKRFNVRYYLLAITFLVFDVEIIFLYPWATTFRQIDPTGPTGTMFVGRILFFLLTSVVAYAYAWRKGVFRFD
jgi:NADH-quinone oxidoreductase subunit A